MKCNNHKESDAIAVCTFCGRGLCSECAHEIQGKMYCKENGCKTWFQSVLESNRKKAGFFLVAGIVFILVALLMNLVQPFGFLQGLDLSAISLYIFISGVVITLYSRYLVDIQRR